MILPFLKKNIFTRSVYSVVYKKEIGKYFLINNVSVNIFFIKFSYQEFISRAGNVYWSEAWSQNKSNCTYTFDEVESMIKRLSEKSDANTLII